MPNYPVRVPPLPESEWDAETREMLDGLRREGIVYNIFATLARHPRLFERWLVFGNHILSKSSLPPRERELVILRVGYLCKAPYEWGHHVAIGRDAGVSDDEIRRLAEGPDAPGWTPFEAALIRGVDELVADSRVSDATWDALSERYDLRQRMDYVFTVGQYNLVSMALNTFGVELEPGYEGLPETRPSA